MVKVAIAGGISGVGRNVLRAIQAGGKHEPVVLSRSPRPELEKEGVTVYTVDYNKPAHLIEALEGVHTVLSCIWSHGPELGSSQLALLEAAKAAGVKRFVPSDWNVPIYKEVTVYNAKEAVWEAVKASGMEYTRFVPGTFMNMYAGGAPHHPEEAAADYGGPPFLIDLPNRKAMLPGGGTQKVIITNVRDIGRFAAAALDLPHWEPEYRIVGDRISYAELTDLAERITGDKFERTDYPLEKIESVLAGDPDFLPRIFHQAMKAVVDGKFDFEPNLNQLFPDIKPMTMEEFLTRYWGKASD